jgi:hypothetical protein
MKLIHLNNSEEISGKFTNMFNDNILIEPYSKIGLLNVKVTLDDSSIVIAANNNKFKVEYSAGANIKDVELKHDNYTQIQFRNEIMRALNASLTYSNVQNYQIGFQWKTFWTQPKPNYLVIAFNRANQNQLPMNNLIIKENMNITGDEYVKSGVIADPNNGNYDGFVQSERYFNHGCGQFDATVKCPARDMTDVNYTEYGLIVGLIHDNEDKQERNISDFAYAIFTGHHPTQNKIVYFYRYYDYVVADWIDQPTTQELTNNDMLILRLSDGKLHFIIAKNVGETELFNIEYDRWKLIDNDDNDDNYRRKYNCCVSLSRNGSRVDDIYYHYDPFLVHNKLTNTFYYYENEEMPWEVENSINYQGIEQLQARPRTKITLLLNDIQGNILEIGKIMGFKEQPPGITGSRGRFNATNDFIQFYLPNLLKIETTNINLNSFDHRSKGRRNILMTIANLVYDNDENYDHDEVTWFTDNPLMIDMDNANQLLLNNIGIQLLDENNQLVKVLKNQFDITLVIE